MFQCALIIVALAMKLISCSNDSSDTGTSDSSSTSKKPHCQRPASTFRFSRGTPMFFSTYGIPYHYHVPKVDLILEDLNNGRIRVSRNAYFTTSRKQASTPIGDQPTEARETTSSTRVHPNSKLCWRLAATTRELTALEWKNAHLRKRDEVPLNRLMMLLESPVFLGHFFYALTSATETENATVLSRFYYAPVLTATCGRGHKNSKDLTVCGMELDVFSVCIEPSDAPEDASIPLMHRPQRIIDAGLRKSSHNAAYDVRTRLREDITDKFSAAESQFMNEKWNALFADPTRMAYKRPPKRDSLYGNIKTPFGDYYEARITHVNPGQAAFHRYDFLNGAYIFAYGSGDKKGFAYSTDGIKMLIFLNPKTHFKNENMLWDTCVDLWKDEMRARYGTETNSRLIHPRAYLEASVSTAPYPERLPRYGTLRRKRDLEPEREAGQLASSSEVKMTRRRRNSRRLKRPATEDSQSSSGLSEAPGTADTTTDQEESGGPMPLYKRYLPACSVLRPGGLTDPWPRNAATWTDAPSSSAYDHDPSTPGTSGVSNNGWYPH